MNLFWKVFLGRLTPTVKYEREENEILSIMNRYKEVGQSIELAEYKSLYKVIKSSEFKERKKILQNRKYKDTEEYRDLKKFKKLKNKSHIQLYYDTLKSNILSEYLAFKSSPEYTDLGDKNKVKNSEKLRHLKHFEKSKAYKTYMRFHDTYIIKELEQLNSKVSTTEFKKSNEFWANGKRWLSTPEYIQEQRYYQLAKNPDIEFYENQKTSYFKKYDSLELVFDEEFKRNTLDKTRWQFGFYYGNKDLISSHSFNNEQQANNNGKNTTVNDDVLAITTKQENIKATAWHQTKGFIEKEFKFTSDILQTSEFFRLKEGYFTAKIKCTGNIHHAFWLGSDKKLPHINIFHYNGKAITVGYALKDKFEGTTITGINPGYFYIYSLLWTEKELIWYINNLEVYRTDKKIPKEALYLAFNSFIPENQKADTGILEVDWLKVYALKK